MKSSPLCRDSRHWHYSGAGVRGELFMGVADGSCQAPDGREIENHANINFEAQLVSQSRCNLSGSEGMSTHLEQVFIHPNSIAAQHFAPDGSKCFFEGRTRIRNVELRSRF